MPRDMEAARRDHELHVLRARLARAELERDVLLQSTSWRATDPVRSLVQRMPPWLQRASRSVLRSMVRPGAGVIAFDAATSASHGVSDRAYAAWVSAGDTLSPRDRELIRRHVVRLPHKPLISVVMPATDTSETFVRSAIASVRTQLYPHWELCIGVDADPSSGVFRIVRDAAAADRRIKLVRCTAHGGTAVAVNAALALAEGEYVAMLETDDTLAEQALYEVAVELAAHPEADLIYSDEDCIDRVGHRHAPAFKPDWNFDLVLGHDLVGHLAVYRRQLVTRIGGMRPALEGSHAYDLALRAVALTSQARIRHIPAILYHARRKTTYPTQLQRDQQAASSRRAAGEFLATCGLGALARVQGVPGRPDWNRVTWALPDPAPRVSLIVPTRDRPDLLRRCAAGLLERTDYPDIELIIVDNDSSDPEALDLLRRLGDDPRVRVVAFPGAFNYSALNNAAAAIATGEVLVLVNNDIDVIEPGWLREMVAHAMRPDVGAVGAKLLFADGTIQHGGVVVGVGILHDGPGVAGHFGLGADAREPGYLGQSFLTREVSAVTGACLALRKSVFEDVGGLDAAHLAVAFNDVDLCLRIRASGLRIVWTPFAELYHLESASRGSDFDPQKIERFKRECATMRDRWGPELDLDPFYNVNFAREDQTFRLAVPPRRVKPWRR